MNERIRELQSKSYLMCKQIVDDDGHVVVTPDRWFDAFAELLIQECIECCDQVIAKANDDRYREGATDASRERHECIKGGAINSKFLIMDRFGVE